MTDYNKQLVGMLKELGISDETIISIEMIIRKKNIDSKEVIEELNKYKSSIITDDTILDLTHVLLK